MSGNAGPGSGAKRRKWLWVFVLLIAAGAGATAVILPRASEEPKPAAHAAVVAPDEDPMRVGCRGWIEPEDGVLRIAAPSLSTGKAVIATLQVKEGAPVKAGQVLAILDGRSSLEKTLREAEADIEVARKKLAKVKAGAKAADIDAQKVEVARSESEYAFAQTDYQRYQRLRETENVTAADLDQRRQAVERAKLVLDAQRERLKSLQEIPKEDVDLVSAELDAAMAKADYARNQIERTVVRAPVSGTVLKILAHEGEDAGPDGILELGKTNRMFVVAEVYETDIGRVRLGQKATISGDILPGKIEGTVTLIGNQVTRSQLLPSDTAAFADTRVVKVNIKLENGERVAGLIHGKVDVIIQQ
jgi:HlyD family secretion protein